ncbi:prepilin peptidase-dependent pilin [Budvicia diplopodorum]|uniref:prepilin peptidase-dependent pilin n=1 Tax=Budvicia diplopodorum TaxID=1119056 RepID=UPI001358F517|nr:prepilin peptidase-dependent pilin [Budvicia diplopodorum]
MQHQGGFTLFELMIVIAIIAILTAVGLPAYQGYIQKAALTDMLQAMVPYKTAIELCSLENGNLAPCDNNSNGIPADRATRYVQKIVVSGGSITLTGQSALQDLTVTLIPTLDPTSGGLIWQRSCKSAKNTASLEQACHDIFRFNDVSNP